MATDEVLDMSCTCDPVDRADEDACVARVAAALAPLRDGFVNAVVADLMLGGEARQITILADQWFGVEIELKDGWTIFLPCDDVEHGLARLWEAAEARRTE